MKKEKVVFDFIKLSPTEKLEFGTNVEIKLTNNPNFPTPDVSLDVLREKNSQLQSGALLHSTEVRKRLPNCATPPASGTKLCEKWPGMSIV